MLGEYVNLIHSHCILHWNRIYCLIWFRDWTTKYILINAFIKGASVHYPRFVQIQRFHKIILRFLFILCFYSAFWTSFYCFKFWDISIIPHNIQQCIFLSSVLNTKFCFWILQFLEVLVMKQSPWQEVDLATRVQILNEAVCSLLYSHNDINHNNNTNTYTNTGGLFRFGYEQVY